MTLTLCSAGAGSGKTYSICKAIIAAVVKDGLDPARLIATTYTRKAAAELKGRIEAGILSAEQIDFDERLRLMERLDLAAIGTVHSVGQRFIERSAIELGMSPRLELLEEGAEERHLNRLLADLDPAERDALIKVGQALDISDPERVALDLLGHVRGNRISDTALLDDLRMGADRLSEITCRPDRVRDVSGVSSDLRRLAQQAIDDLVASGDSTKRTEGVVKKLSAIVQQQHHSWSAIATVSGLEAAKKVDDCLIALRTFAADVRSVRMLHDQMREFADRLARHVMALERAYARYKSDRGLVDFGDLELTFLRLLENDTIAAKLKSDYALAVVDEFQDTNPLQLAIFMRLRGLVGDSYWVGDAKQAIYGFRGSDERLIRDVWAANEGDARTQRLPKNYRSKRGLVQLVNALFEPIFGKKCPLDPYRASADACIERWHLEKDSGRANQTKDAAAVAKGVRQLIDESTRPSEIAILVRSRIGGWPDALAEQLDELAVPSALAVPGLLSTREGALTLAGLRLVADRRDSLAAATVVHLLSDPTADTPAWLEQRIRVLAAAQSKRPIPWEADPVLAALSHIDRRTTTPASATAAVIAALRLGERVAEFGNPAARAVNLDGLIALAESYESQAGVDGLAATIAGLVAHLEALHGNETDVCPAPAGMDAVTISTVHGSKGLQWPVVILTQLDKAPRPRFLGPSVSGGDVSDGAPLRHRRLHFWPWPFGKDEWGKLNRSAGLEDDMAQTPEGLQARADAEAESLRLLYVAMTRAADKLVLAHRANKHAWLDQLPDAARLLPEHQPEGDYPLDGIDTTMRIRRLTPSQGTTVPASTCRWLSSPTTALALSPDRTLSPSARHEDGRSIDATPTALPGLHPFGAALEIKDAAALGDAVHAYLAAMPSAAHLDDAARIAIALRCLARHGCEGEVPADKLVDAGRRLGTWLEAEHAGCTARHEVELVAPRTEGGRWVGSVDLLLRRPDGQLVVIDHKSARVGESGWRKVARSHVGQLRAYAEALEALDETIHSTWIHFPLGGVVVRLTCT